MDNEPIYKETQHLVSPHVDSFNWYLKESSLALLVSQIRPFEVKTLEGDILKYWPEDIIFAKHPVGPSGKVITPAQVFPKYHSYWNSADKHCIHILQEPQL